MKIQGGMPPLPAADDHAESKVEAIALLKDTTSKLAGLSSHYPFNAERQAEKREYQLLKSIGLTRREIESRPTDYEEDANH